MKHFILTIAMFVVAISARSGFCAGTNRLAAPIDTFLKRNCIRCHGEETQESELRFDRLSAPTAEGQAGTIWSRIIEVLDAGEMPPQDEPRLTALETQTVVRQISQALARSVTARPIALRRLNRREYEYTIHDLLGIDVPLADLLPEDGRVQGFDNVTDGLNISSVLMEQYLVAANVAFDAVIRRIKPLPAETRRAMMMDTKENIESVAKKKGGTIKVEDSFVNSDQAGRLCGWIPFTRSKTESIAAASPCGRTIQANERCQSRFTSALLFGPETRQFIGIFDVTGTPEKPRIIEFTTRFDEGHAIHIEPRIWPEHVTWRDKHEAQPGVGVVWAETHGPLDQSFPSESQRRLFGDSDTITLVEDKPIYIRHRRGVKLHVVESSQPQRDADRIVRELIPKAFRRPVTESEMQPFVQLTLGRLEAGRTFEQAVRAGVTAVLCSPQFLLLNQANTVDDFTIASRLSYFLWSTLPDEPLMKLAAAGRLSDPNVRHAQVERMIADPRIARFVRSFTDQWLDLQDIEFTTPAKKVYPEFDPLLQEAMLGETRHFFTNILHDDLSVLNFVDADFTFLNQRLAHHYGIPGVRGNEHFQKVTLPANSIRGGILTQASVLKVTANGTTTSPVTRGVWVMDRILGRPLPPPPPGVPAVEPDIRGATSIREQLEKHRDIESCNRCHKRIDPPGFAMEQFDAIGGERQWYRSIGEGKKLSGKLPYRKGPDVQPAGTLSNGRVFSDFAEFRTQLRAESNHVARAIATRLLVYATGRPLSSADREIAETIVEPSRSNPLGLKSMIHAVVDSKLFLEP